MIAFNKRKSEILGRMGKTSIGLAKSEGKYNEEEVMNYLTLVQVESLDSCPEGMLTYRIPETTYAVFENIGLGDKTVHTISYIYGTWLPQSVYRRAEGDDYELFDHRYDLSKDDSISEYFLPIKKL